MLGMNEVLDQSKAAYGQWKDTWDKHAIKNGKLLKKLGTSQQDILFIGAGRTLICCATGPSFFDQIEDLKIKNDAIDIACVDKCFGTLLDHDIKPEYVFIADAGIDYEKWCKPWIDKTKDIILFANVTANTEWTHNWKGPIYFYVNKDNIETEKIYSKLSGCYELIPASSNVGNTVVVFAKQNFCYDEYLLMGYDFCWGDDDYYYAFEDNNKRYWMGHAIATDGEGRLIKTSQNLLFSARWLSDFYLMNIKNIPKTKLFKTSMKGILAMPYRNLKKVIKTIKERELSEQEKNIILQKRIKKVSLFAKDGEEKLKQLVKELAVAQVDIYHVPKEVQEWVGSS
jgi:hypothetical protein